MLVPKELHCFIPLQHLLGRTQPKTMECKKEKTKKKRKNLTTPIPNMDLNVMHDITMRGDIFPSRKKC